MMEARATTARLAASLARKAERIARAHAVQTTLKRREDARRWRRPALLWPLFTKE